MEKKIDSLFNNWQKRNITGFYCKDKQGAIEKVQSIIPQDATIGICGSITLDTLGMVARLEARGNRVFSQYKSGIAKEESLEIRRQGTNADYFLASANAISEDGELVFLSAYGNRIAGIANAKHVIVICGVNKITPNLEKALKRAREYATPLNCKRLNWKSACLEGGVCQETLCFSPEYNRMCCQVLIIEAEAVQDRLKVILVDEDLGF